jgi:multidrug efflux pump subunit AcrA (membrane-fusion protein)
VDLYEHDKWFGAKLAAGARKGVAAVVGPKHTWLKVAAVAVLGLAAFGVFAYGTYKVDAPFTLDVLEKQVVSAPYDSFIETVAVEPGDVVVSAQTAALLDTINALPGPLARPLGAALPPTTLATLHTEDLRSRRAEAVARRAQALKEEDMYRREPDKVAESQLAGKRAEEAQAQIDYFDHQIAQAAITAPFDGVVLSGELKQKLNAAVKQGDQLFEIAPIESLRAVLSVPEDQIAEVTLGAAGELATTSYPDQRIPFTVEWIKPVADVVKDKNVYKVRVVLSDVKPWMKPGMEGVAKIHIRQARWGWLVTHRVVKWVQMKLWW